MERYGQQLNILLEYKDQLDDYLNNNPNISKNEYEKIDNLICEILDLKDNIGIYKNKIEKEYKYIIKREE